MAVFSSSEQSGAAGPRGSFPGGLSIVGPGAKFVGELETEGVVRIEGRVEGSIKTGQQVLVTDGGVVAGNIQAREVVIGGEVEGDVQSAHRVELHGGGHVRGDVTAPRVVIRDGGRLNGRLQMVDLEARGRQPGHAETEQSRPALRSA